MFFAIFPRILFRNKCFLSFSRGFCSETNVFSHFPKDFIQKQMFFTIFLRILFRNKYFFISINIFIKDNKSFSIINRFFANIPFFLGNARKL